MGLAAKIVALIAFANAVALAQQPSASVSWSAAPKLPTLLSRFESEHEVSRKERLLFEITTAHFDAGASLLEIAKTTQDSDTKWLAIRGIGG